MHDFRSIVCLIVHIGSLVLLRLLWLVRMSQLQMVMGRLAATKQALQDLRGDAHATCSSAHASALGGLIRTLLFNNELSCRPCGAWGGRGGSQHQYRVFNFLKPCKEILNSCCSAQHTQRPPHVILVPGNVRMLLVRLRKLI
jgi:hypothetical protein